MFLRDTLLDVLKSQTPPAPDQEVAREISTQIPARSSHAIVFTGVRRAGKSVLQSQVMRHHKHAVYSNLEDTRLFGFGPDDFPAFLSVIEEITPSEGWVFLDEVQEVVAWQGLVRSLLDRGYGVCVTGSNASVLGRELGSKLTGRHLSFEVFPFSYAEFLTCSKASPGADSLQNYLDAGGFPAYLREGNPQILQELLRDIVQRDIASRHRLHETGHVMNLALFLLANTGQPLSLQKLTKSLAIPSVGQTSRYVEYLRDAYLLFALPKFSASFKQRVVAPNKYYAIDTGLRKVTSPQFSADVGHRLENAVFLALRRRGAPIFYASEKDSWECDFVTETESIQVCAELGPHNLAREVRGLAHACALPGKRRPLILTLSQRDSIATGGMQIDVRPTWQWLLGE